MKTTLAGIAGLCIALWGAGAVAQAHPTAGGPRIIDRIARHHFELGNEYFQVARYDEAAHEFQQAYDITHQVEILYNIARAREGAGDIAGALQVYEQFDQAGAPGIDRDLLHERMQNLRARVAASQAPANGTTQTSSASPEPTASPAPSASAAPMPASPAPSSPAPETQYTYRRGALASYGPFVAIGLGVVLGGVAGVFAGLAESDYGAVNSANTGMTHWTTATTSSYSNAPAEGTVAWVLGGVGAACIVGGVLWLALRGPGERVPVNSAHLILAPSPSGNGAMVGIGGAL